MRYQVITDNDGYVLNIRHTNNPRLDFVELDLSQYDLSGLRKQAYKLGKDELIFDNERYKELTDEKQKKEDNQEIIFLKGKLTDSDYIVARAFEEVMALTNPLTWVADVLKITIKYAQKYKDTIANRKTWRERIQELEDKWKL